VEPVERALTPPSQTPAVHYSPPPVDAVPASRATGTAALAGAPAPAAAPHHVTSETQTTPRTPPARTRSGRKVAAPGPSSGSIEHMLGGAAQSGAAATRTTESGTAAADDPVRTDKVLSRAASDQRPRLIQWSLRRARQSTGRRRAEGEGAAPAAGIS
jgi:hypothetical protein